MYKKYRNEIVELLKIHKQSFCHKSFLRTIKKIIKLSGKIFTKQLILKKTKKNHIVSALTKDGKTITNIYIRNDRIIQQFF